MANIDDKVVAISFESGKFEQGVNRTISALDKLKAALHFPNSGKQLDDINAAAKRVDLSHIGRGVDDIKNKLSALSVAALAIFANIAMKAVDAGARIVKAFTLDPIKQGFAEYSTNLNAIQTILANTQAAGTNLKDVNKALQELNEYSDKTIYNFSQMARNIGTFTAAGVALEPAVASIKGIANLAALSGSNSEQASTAMYQLSQAISAGSVKLQDWNSVVNAGMGGTVFQRALATTAEAMGTLEKGAVKLEGPMKNVSIHGEAFRQSLSTPGKASWLTSDVLTKTLQQFTGDLNDAELAAMGFNDAQIKAIQQTAKTAMHAATEVKTISQVFDVAKETAGSGWAQTFQIIFGTFSEAKKTFTDLSNTINGFINTNADARNKVLADWKALGGRTVLIDSIKTAFHNLGMVIAPIKEAFRDIFPAVTGKNLYDLTLRFQDFAEALRPSAETVENLKRTFRGFFALLDIGKQIIGGILGVFARLFGVWAEGAGGFLNFTGNIGDFLVMVDQTLKKGTKLNDFFQKLGDILQVPVEMIKTLSGTLVGLFSGALPGTLGKQLSGLGETLSPIEIFANNLAKTWNRLLVTFNDTLDALGPAFDAVISLIEGLGTAIGEAASHMNFDAILQVINTGLFAGLVLLFKNFFGKGSMLEQISKGFGGGIIQNIAGSFKALEGSMVAMQQNIKAQTLKEIAIAVALLAAAVLAISLIDPAKLNQSLAGIAIMMGELVGAMALLNKIGGTASFVKLPIMAAGLIALAGAIDLLVIAVFALSKLSWGELLKGLAGVAALLGTLVVAAGPLAASSSGMIRAGIGISAIAVGLNLLAIAVRILATLSLAELGKGLVGVATGLGVLVAGMNKMPKNIFGSAAGLILVAGALNLLGMAVQRFGGMDLMSMAKGLGAIAISLGILALGMKIMPSKAILSSAAGLLILSVALNGIAMAVERMGGMGFGQMAKGLIGFGVALGILAIGLKVIEASIGGAVALGIIAGSMVLLSGAVMTLGQASWGTLIKGLVTLAAIIGVLAGAALLLTPAVPAMLAFGIALTLIGAGLALAGAGIFLVATGLSALVVAAPTGIGIIIAALKQLTQGIIENAKLMALGILEVVKAFAATAPQFVDAVVKILSSLIDGIITMMPKIQELFNSLIDMILAVLQQNQGKIVQAGFNLIIALLTGIRNNIPTLVTLIVDIITRILNTIASNLGRIITAGLNLLTSFIKGIASGYAQVVTAALQIVTQFLATIASNLGKFVTAGLSILTSLLKAIASKIGDVVKAGVDIIVAFIEGIGNAGDRIIRAGTQAIIKLATALEDSAEKLVQAGFRLAIKFLNSLADTIEQNSGQVRGAAARVGVAIIDGMTGGLVSKAQGLYNTISGIMDKAMSIMHKIPIVGSPSKVTMDIGKAIMDGLFLGISGNGKAAITASEEMSRLVIAKFAEVFQTYSPSKVMEEIGQYVGQGFVKGLRGSQDDIRESFTELNKMLTDAMTTARETIASEQKKLKELREADKPDIKAIGEAQKVIKQNQDLLSLSTAGHIALTQTLKTEKAELLSLAGDYEKISEKLNKANEALAAAKKTRDDAMKSYAAQYATLPEVAKEGEMTGAEQLTQYLQSLQDQTNAVAAYRSTLDQLRALGLDDATYQKLLEEGTADQEFATALLAGGKTAVQGLNTLDAQLKTEADKLGKNAARNLYQKGVDSAQRLVDGLGSKKKAIKDQMDETSDDVINGLANGLRSKAGSVYDAIADIANQMIATLKKNLKIKSPSEVFADLGQLSVEGLAEGFTKSSHIFVEAVDSAATTAIDTMKKSIGNISDAVAGQLNTNPVITPILDLTTVRGQAQELKALTNVTPITAAASYGQASLISAEQLAAQTDETTAIGRGATSVKFEQNNYSPEALTEIEIYRQTKNQLSQLKTALDLA